MSLMLSIKFYAHVECTIQEGICKYSSISISIRNIFLHSEAPHENTHSKRLQHVVWNMTLNILLVHMLLHLVIYCVLGDNM